LADKPSSIHTASMKRSMEARLSAVGITRA
jgi:hypothetical protein